jgi:hypothetical protein
VRAAIVLAFGIRIALTPSVAAGTLPGGVMVPAGAPPSASAPLPDYSGVWKLNRELSDDPAQAMKEWHGSSGGGSGSSGGWHGHGRGRRGGGGGNSGDAESGAGEPSAFAALETLTIRHSEPSITIVDAAGREHSLTTDGKTFEEERSHGGTTKVAATWRDGHLEIVSAPERGPRWTETYAITADRSQLTVTTKIEGSRGGAATIRRVYDAVPPVPEAPPADEAPAPQDDSVSTR